MSYPSRRPALLALTSAFAILLVACSAGATPSAAPPSPGTGGTPPPSSQPSDTPTTGTIDHKTGATDVILRLDEGGGFVMPAFLASQVPHFTLYGDGTVIFRNPML